MKKEIINKRTLQHLAELARIEIEEEKEKKLLGDIEKILEYFEELKEINTANIEPLAGAADLINIYRADKKSFDGLQRKQEELIELFPERENNYLRVPPVFTP